MLMHSENQAYSSRYENHLSGLLFFELGITVACFAKGQSMRDHR
jgi:hypothetical protein